MRATVSGNESVRSETHFEFGRKIVETENSVISRKFSRPNRNIRPFRFRFERYGGRVSRPLIGHRSQVHGILVERQATSEYIIINISFNIDRNALILISAERQTFKDYFDVNGLVRFEEKLRLHAKEHDDVASFCSFAEVSWRRDKFVDCVRFDFGSYLR